MRSARFSVGCKIDFRRVPSANPAKERGAGSPLVCSRQVHRSRVSAPRPSGRPFAATRAASQFCKAFLAFGLAGMIAASCHRMVPPAKPPFTITGVVEAIDPETLAVRHKSGQRVKIALASATQVSRLDSPAASADIEVGMRIVVLYRFVDGRAVADQVRLFRDAIKTSPKGSLLLS